MVVPAPHGICTHNNNDQGYVEYDYRFPTFITSTISDSKTTWVTTLGVTVCYLSTDFVQMSPTTVSHNAQSNQAMSSKAPPKDASSHDVQNDGAKSSNGAITTSQSTNVQSGNADVTSSQNRVLRLAVARRPGKQDQTDSNPLRLTGTVIRPPSARSRTIASSHRHYMPVPAIIRMQAL